MKLTHFLTSAACALACNAHAAIIAVNPVEDGSNGVIHIGSATLGWSFTARANLTVTELGYTAAHQVL